MTNAPRLDTISLSLMTLRLTLAPDYQFFVCRQPEEWLSLRYFNFITLSLALHYLFLTLCVA